MSNLYGDVERSIVEGNSAFDNPVQKDEDWVCEDCGCDKVQTRCWVEYNTDKVMDSCEDGETYCPDCEEYTCIITRKEWEDDKEEDDDSF